MLLHHDHDDEHLPHAHLAIKLLNQRNPLRELTEQRGLKLRECDSQAEGEAAQHVQRGGPARRMEECQ